MHRTFVLLAAVLAFSLPVQAATHTRARLVLSADMARAGDTVLAGVHLRMEPGWHTYWQNSGASGAPTTIEWTLPKGVTAEAIQWPVPEKLPEQDLTTYIYKEDVVLLVPLKLASDLQAGPLELKARVDWLECEVLCQKGGSTLKATLNVGNETKPSPEAEFLATWQKKLPQNADKIAARAWWEKPPNKDERPMVIEWATEKSVAEADFFPDSFEQFEVQGPTERVPADSGKVQIRKVVKKSSGDWPASISGVVVQQSAADKVGYQVRVPVQPERGPAGTAAKAGTGFDASTLLGKLALAFVGGLILNVMPCVLPVIALKILGFVGQARDDPRRVRKFGILYTIGVLVSFLALAALVLAVEAAGHKAGWGMQFSNPQFVVVLTVLVTLIALNLFGLFEITPTGRVMDAAGALSGKQGAAGAFFNGVLATVLATPCTAPILAGALGFAFLTRSAWVIVLFFSTIGLGLALPYLLLSWNPKWLRFLPKPGAWMQNFKVLMGFPMLATAFWLFSLLPIHYGERAWWLGMFLVIVALAGWMYGEFVQKGSQRRGLARVLVLLVLVGGYVFVVDGKLRWRSPDSGSAETASKPNSDGIAWQPWSPEAVKKAREEGRPVLVDFTAKWCITCNSIVKPALESATVRKKIEQLHVVPLLADYTKTPDYMTEELNRFGRSGVPLVLVYSPDPTQEPAVYDLVTPGLIADALDKAAQQQPRSAAN